MSKRNHTTIPNDDIPEIFEGKTYLDPTYDPAFQAFFDDEAALRDFINCVLDLEPGRQINKLTYHFEDRQIFRTPERKSIRFDVRAFTEDNRFLNVELQRAKHAFFIDRVLLYSCFLAIKAKQDMKKSSDFKKLSMQERKKRKYELPETISIWLCNFHPREGFEEYKDSWGIFSEKDLAAGRIVAISEKIRYIIIDLPAFAALHKPVNSREDLWLFLLTQAGNLDELPEYDDPIISGAIDRIRVDNASRELLEKQESSMIEQDEYDCRLAEATLNGLEEGRAKGLEEGLEKGLEKGRAESAAKIAELEAVIQKLQAEKSI